MPTETKNTRRKRRQRNDSCALLADWDSLNTCRKKPPSGTRRQRARRAEGNASAIANRKPNSSAIRYAHIVQQPRITRADDQHQRPEREHLAEREASVSATPVHLYRRRVSPARASTPTPRMTDLRRSASDGDAAAIGVHQASILQGRNKTRCSPPQTTSPMRRRRRSRARAEGPTPCDRRTEAIFQERPGTASVRSDTSSSNETAGRRRTQQDDTISASCARAMVGVSRREGTDRTRRAISATAGS